MAMMPATTPATPAAPGSATPPAATSGMPTPPATTPPAAKPVLPPTPALKQPAQPPAAPSAPAPQPAQPVPPPQPAAAQSPTQTQPSTVPTTSGQPASVSTTPAPAQPTQPAQQTTSPAPALDAQSIVAKLPKNNNISPEQQHAFAAGLTESIKGKEALVNGARELAAGQNSPAAKEFQAHMQQFEKQWIDEHMQKAIQENPDAGSSAQGWGQMFGQISQQWQQMPQEMKWAMGLGLGGGLLGMASSIFGEGGGVMGLLGLLGIGGGLAAGAAGGMFGQDMQNTATDAMYNVGSFLGAVPDPKPGRFKDLKGADAIERLAAPPTLQEKGTLLLDAKGQAAKIREDLAMAEKADNLLLIPEQNRPRFIQKMDPSLSYEEAAQVAKNIVALSAQMKDPQSALYKKMQQGRELAESKDPQALVNQKAYDATIGPYVNAGLNAWNKLWTPQQQQPLPAEVAAQPEKIQSMNIARLVEKLAASSPAWQRSEGKNDEGGLNAKGRASYNKATGGHLKAPVTESNPKGDRAKRQNSFCSRMCGMKRVNTGSKTKSDPDSRINKSLRKWNCKCSSAREFGEKLARCWAGYEPVPGAKAYSKGSCRPKGSKKTQKEMKKS